MAHRTSRRTAGRLILARAGEKSSHPPGMAEDVHGGDDAAAEVKLTADAKPFEDSLNKAAANVDAWAAKVSSRFDSLTTSIQAKTSKLTAAFNSVTSQMEGGISAGEAIGAGAGAALGAAAGSWVGPVGTVIGTGLGAAIGANVGKAIEQNVDFTAIIEGLGAFGKGIKAQFTEGEEAAKGFWWSVKDQFGGFKDLVNGIDLKDFFSGSTADVTARFEALANDVGNRLDRLFKQALARTVDFIDSAFDKLREPLARVADWVQDALRQIGLVDAGTQSWGDSLRQLKDVGTEVFAAIGRGLGYVNDVLVVVKGAIQVALIAPFYEFASVITHSLSQASETIAGFLKGVQTGMTGVLQLIVDLGDPGGFAQKALDKLNDFNPSAAKVDEALKRAGDEFAAKAEKAIKDGGENLSREIGKTARELDGKFRGFAAEGKMFNALDDAIRTALAGVGAGLEVAIENAAAPVEMANRKVAALVGGSQAATSAIIANTTNGGPQANPGLVAQQKAAFGIEQMVAVELKVLDALLGLNQAVKDKPVVVVDDE